MPATLYYMGKNAHVGVAINADNGGVTFDGTPGDYDHIPIKKLAVTPREDKTYNEGLTVNQEDYCRGGRYYTLVLEVELSYAYQEKLIQLALGGEINTTGSDPYDHDIAIADELLMGSLILEYGDQAAAADEIVAETFANIVVTGMEIKHDTQGFATATFNMVSSGMTRVNNQAAFTSTETLERIKFRHLAPTLNGTGTHRLGNVSVAVNQPVSEGEFDFAATTPETVDFWQRGGVREVTGSFDIPSTSASYDEVDDGDTEWDGTNTLVWNNGESGTDEREFKITMGHLVVEDPGRSYESLGRVIHAGVSVRAMHSSGTPSINIDVKNGRSSIPA